MRKDEIEKKIKDSFEEETPRLYSRIMESCEREKQIMPSDVTALKQQRRSRARKVILGITKGLCAATLSLCLFVTGIAAGSLATGLIGKAQASKTESYVYIDVNPSVELHLNSKEQVVECIAKNSDAEKILEKLELEGTNINTALAAITGSMYVNGYITDTANSILVSVDTSEKKREGLMLDITDGISAVFASSQIEISIIAQELEVDDDLRERAEKNNVSVGKMSFVDKMVDKEDERSEYAELSIHDLNLIYKNIEKGSEDKKFDKDISVGNVGGYISADRVSEILLEHTGITENMIEDIEISVRPERADGKPKMVYTVSVSIRGEDEERKFKIDCTTGEVISESSQPPRAEEEKEKPEDIPHEPFSPDGKEEREQ